MIPADQQQNPVRSDGSTILFGLPEVAVREVQRGSSGPSSGPGGVCVHRRSGGRVPFSEVVGQRVPPGPATSGTATARSRCAVRWHKRQYRCVEEACPRTAFTECIAELPAGARRGRGIGHRRGPGVPGELAGRARRLRGPARAAVPDKR